MHARIKTMDNHFIVFHKDSGMRVLSTNMAVEIPATWQTIWKLIKAKFKKEKVIFGYCVNFYQGDIQTDYKAAEQIKFH